MKLQWFWNKDFEGLMEAVGGFLTEHKDITVVNVQYTVVNNLWYFTMFYKT